MEINLMLQQVTFKEIVIDGKTKSPRVHLQDESDNILQIYVGEDQVRSVLVGTNMVDNPTRPMTHDLFANVLASWSLDVEKVVIKEVNDNDVYIASLIIKQGDTTKEIDCRPSDAIALAVRVNCPIFVSETLMQKNLVTV